MLLHLPFHTDVAPVNLKAYDRVLLCGSCFTEHIGSKMKENRMDALVNPFGTLFHPLSIARNLQNSLAGNTIEEQDLFINNEIWNHWDFHSRLSHFDKYVALENMNLALSECATRFHSNEWLFVTFGSAFQYSLSPQSPFNLQENLVAVANCHKVPGSFFKKELVTVDKMQEVWGQLIRDIQTINPKMQIVFTVSPVRHVRDGLVENNRSKARLIETVAHLTEHFQNCHYFPAYELVIDVLRDYRFYTSDMVHPNDIAVDFVWEKFVDSFFDVDGKEYLIKLGDINRLLAHKPRFEQTKAHLKMQATVAQKIDMLVTKYPWLATQIW